MAVLFCLPLLVAGWGLAGSFASTDVAAPTPAEGVFYGSLSSSSVLGVTILDPLAATEVIAAAKTVSAGLLVGVLPVLVVYGLVRGRAFCGWVCPVNLLLEGLDWLRRKLGLQVAEQTVPRRAKIGIAAGVVVLSALLSFPVFQAFSPIGAVNRGILFGAFSGLGVLAAIAVLELFWSRRVWCRALCPLGGVYEALGRIGQVNVAIDHDACIHCGKCEAACLADPEILQPALAGEDRIVRAGDCMACGACIDACPTDALAMSLGRARAKQPANAEEPGLSEA